MLSSRTLLLVACFALFAGVVYCEIEPVNWTEFLYSRHHFIVKPGAEDVVLSFKVRNVGSRVWTHPHITVQSTGNSKWFPTPVESERVTGEFHANSEAEFFITLPATTQVGLHQLEVTLYQNNQKVGQLTRAVDVSCSDGIFCNGIERYINGACVNGPEPCDDGHDCSTDVCDEATAHCSWVLTDDCPKCQGVVCVPSCEGRECGTDGCYDRCGTCAEGFSCESGTCVNAAGSGTCKAPIELVPAGFSFDEKHIVRGDTTDGFNEIVPSCNFLSDAPEKVYVFTIPAGRSIGLEAQVHYDGPRSEEEYDTVMELRTVCDDVTSVVRCSDDSTPPGFLGSRFHVLLEPGTYYLVVDGYSFENFGPFYLDTTWSDTCEPLCDGAFCGSNECGGSCGDCGAGMECNDEFGRCTANPCIPDCAGKQCGDDGCGGTCGECTGNFLCVDETLTCEEFFPCDHFLPDCRGLCNSNEYCSGDCLCHTLDEARPDLFINSKSLGIVEFTYTKFASTSCAIYERCINSTGTRRLMRMTIDTPNQGFGGMEPPDPKTRPDLFQFSPCHQHYHFNGYAILDMLEKNSDRVVTRGYKEGFCMEDSSQYHFGPRFPCAPAHDCGKQGINAGWSDVYGPSLDCNWVDVTDLAPGEYRLRLVLNSLRILDESSYDNNVAIVAVTIPDDGAGPSTHSSLFSDSNPHHPHHSSHTSRDSPSDSKTSRSSGSSSSAATLSMAGLLLAVLMVALM